MLAWQWMRGADGLAVAQWASALFSVFAIAIALFVFLAEQRRANAEKALEATRERKALEQAAADKLAQRARSTLAVVDLLNQAYNVMTEDLPDVGAMYMTWSPDRGKPFTLTSLKKSLEAVQRAVVDDIKMLIWLSDAVSIIDATILPTGMDRSPHVSAVLRVLKEQAMALDGVRKKVLATHTRIQAFRSKA